MLNPKNRLAFKCFSPLVMLVTMAIEAIGMIWVLWRYKHTAASRLIAAILFFLAAFQLAEYMVCERAEIFSSLTWAKMGFASISILPALGMHLAFVLAKKSSKLLITIGYLIAASFAVFFLTAGQGISAEQCAGNYVIFKMMPEAVYLYAAYYYTWIVSAMIFTYTASQKKVKNKTALHYLALGYALFIIPTTVVNLINPETISAIPSIMCGFAVLLAFCLLFGVAPNTDELKKKKQVVKTKRK